MKKIITTFLLCGLMATVHAATTIDAANRYACGANIGWMDWRGDTNSGAVIGEYVCSGYIYSANVGWIALGSGSPANLIQYQNNSAMDFGVNHDGLGNLIGYAYGANIGWINFEQTYGQPRVDLFTGRLSGYAYSANCGWISLSNAFAYVQTTSIAPGADTDGDGIADAWERLKFGNLTTAAATSDFDGDGATDRNEYLADTNPKDSGDYLRVTAIARSPGNTVLNWNAVSSRFYAVQTNAVLGTGLWGDLLSQNLPGWNNANFADATPTSQFYRIRAFRPLTP